MKNSHYTKYENLCHKFSIVWDRKTPGRVNETLKSITGKYKKDKHLNNVPLKLWDRLCFPFSGLSLSDHVCMQKHAAIKMIAELDK